MRRTEIIEREMPEDIRKYKTKVVAQYFTAKQAIYIIAGLFLCYLVFQAFGEYISKDSIIYVVGFIVGPIFALSLEIDGVDIDRYIVKAIIPYMKNGGKKFSRLDMNAADEMQETSKDQKKKKGKTESRKETKLTAKEEKEILKSRPDLKTYR